MDWKDIAGPLVQSAAPTLGSILGGLIPFPGGSLIGQELGQLVANQFGVPATPEAVNAAIQNAPSDIAAAKLQAAEAEAIAKWPALAQIAQADASDRTAQSQAINATMQAEVARGQAWWAWRNLFGYMVTANIGLTSIEVLWELHTGDLKIIAAFTSLSGFFLSWYGAQFGLLGFIFKGASNEKIAAVTGDTPGVVGQIIKAVTKR